MEYGAVKYRSASFGRQPKTSQHQLEIRLVLTFPRLVFLLAALTTLSALSFSTPHVRLAIPSSILHLGKKTLPIPTFRPPVHSARPSAH